MVAVVRANVRAMLTVEERARRLEGMHPNAEPAHIPNVVRYVDERIAEGYDRSFFTDWVDKQKGDVMKQRGAQLALDCYDITMGAAQSASQVQAAPTKSVARERTLQQAASLADASSFDELYQMIDRHGPFRGTLGTYSPEDVKGMIASVLSGEEKIVVLTNTDGLRDAVTKLIARAESVSVEAVAASEARDVLRRAEIHGEEFDGKRLTVEELERNGLAPGHKVRIGDASVWFSSSAYDLGSGRLAVAAYVETEDGGVVVRSYYRSNSQGVWRYLPSYRLAGDGSIDWYSKGRSEESITLPFPAQKALAEITKPGMPVLRVRDPEFIFAGTSRKVVNRDAGRTYLLEVAELPKPLSGNFYGNQGKVPPEQVRFASQADAPDFSRFVMGWKQETSQYGQINVDVFESGNGKYQFMFCSDIMGRAWIGGVEDDSEIKSVGLRRNWITAGDLATPAFEYDSQSGGYGNNGLRRGSYVDMFENYLSRVPVIQEYLQWKAQA